VLALQIKHVDAEVAPEEVEYEPAEQAVHIVDPKEVEYEPAEQAVHDVDPEADHVPALHA
jgi:hypothetical protein